MKVVWFLELFPKKKRYILVFHWLSSKIFCTTSSGVISGVTWKYILSLTSSFLPSTNFYAFLCMIWTLRSIVFGSSSPAGSERAYIAWWNSFPCKSPSQSYNHHNHTIGDTSHLCHLHGTLDPPVPLAHPLQLLLQLHVKHHNLQLRPQPASGWETKLVLFLSSKWYLTNCLRCL